MGTFSVLQVFISFLAVTTAQNCNGYFPDLNVGQTTFLLSSMQESFAKDIKNFDLVVETANKMLTAARKLNITVYASELNPKVYGKTVSSINLGNAIVFSRSTFSMWPQLKKRIRAGGNKEVFVIFGIATHIAVEQTVIDILKADYQVHVLDPGVSSRSFITRSVALEFFKQIGAFIGTPESILYKLVPSTRDPNYNAIEDLNETPLPDNCF